MNERMNYPELPAICVGVNDYKETKNEVTVCEY